MAREVIDATFMGALNELIERENRLKPGTPLAKVPEDVEVRFCGEGPTPSIQSAQAGSVPIGCTELSLRLMLIPKQP